MDKVYVIYKCSGDYDMYTENPIGFKLTESEAIEYVNKNNKHYDNLEELFDSIDFYAFQQEIWNWDNIAEKITENIFNTATDIPGYKDGRIINGNEYANWRLNYLTPLLDKKRVEYFYSKSELQKFLPEGKTWEEFLKLYDDYEDYKQFLYNYRYDVVTKLETE